jgi:hypothetical protein
MRKMPRRSTSEVAEIMADRLVNRGADASREWIRARLLRWGARVAHLTEFDPTYAPDRVVGDDGETYFRVGPDEVPMQVYREWVDVQDGSRKIRGDKYGRVAWED